jgi:hypothetical protein
LESFGNNVLVPFRASGSGLRGLPLAVVLFGAVEQLVAVPAAACRTISDADCRPTASGARWLPPSPGWASA